MSEGQALQTMVLLGKFQKTYFKEFGEPLDPEELFAKIREVQETQRRNIDLSQAYDLLIAPLRQDRSTKKQSEEIAAAEKRGEERALQKLSRDTLPVPTGMEPTISPVLDSVLKRAKDKDGRLMPADQEKFGVDAAVRNTRLRRSGQNV